VSLKAVHILFIVLAASLAFVFGVWSLRFYSVPFAAASFLVGIALVAYGTWFVKKTKGIEGAE
jgi:hypothetical protein